SRDHSRTPM
nr:Chain P, Alpha-glucosidase P1 [synthetic construct]1VAD_P Chain P, YEAST ALPHA-GLUCOSIDASE [Saccharomyces cerevisiae]